MADRRGFTVIELVMVIVLIAILAASVSPLVFRRSASISAGAFAKKVRDDIRYAQSLALIRSNLDTPEVTNPAFMYRIRFNVADPSCPGANQYTIVNDADNNGRWGESPNASGIVESARNPETGSPYFCVQMDSGSYSGITISANFGGSSPGVLQFDTNGIPYDSDNAPLTAARPIVISKGGETVTLTLTPNTGMVR